MYRQFQNRLVETVRAFLHRQYQLDLPEIIVEQPPNVGFGEFAMPLCFELAKKLRKAPRKIAEEIVAGIGPILGFDRLEVAGAGYINARVKRGELAAALAADKDDITPIEAEHHAREKILVEHTSINPNKAAHIGHLRNAILGDTFVRLMRADGYPVDVQNYIDNTGVQVADVVVGFVHLEKKSQAEIEKLIDQDPRFDYTCWDLYARVSQWYTEGKKHVDARLEALHQIEQGGNELAEIARMISETIVAKHLDTMLRLGITYDFLPQESEILHLHFWDSAFQQLKDKGVLTYVEEGKNKGCWVMSRGGAEKPAAESAENAEEDQKVIVRSNGTVTYVGKDIAYHLWKFGLLGKDFGYRRFYTYPDGLECWISTDLLQNEPDHPQFGGVAAIYNVIDARQSDPQNNVVEAIRALGYTAQAEHYTHFSYEMVALTPRCALELGYDIDEEDKARAYIEVSGRKGFGVKADDLIDALIHAARKEVDPRHPELSDDERLHVAMQIAIGALRYFMLRFTKNSVIAFDFKDALAFEGETGPYAQYAVVRASNIFRKAGLEPESFLVETPLADIEFERFLGSGGAGERPASAVAREPDARAKQPGRSTGVAEPSEKDDLWELWLAASKLAYVIEQCISTTEPAFLAKYAFQLAQLFNNFYHRHHIIGETDESKKKFLLATAAVVRRELIRALDVMGITVPPVM